MRIGKQNRPFQRICDSDATSITVRGRDLCGEVIGQLDFTSYFWLLVTNELPSAAQRDMTNAALAAIAEHGLVPSVVAARMTLAAAPEALQGAVAAGLLGCGSVVLGSAEAAGSFYSELLQAGARELPRDDAIVTALRALRADKRPIPGFGHPQHSGGDPRAARLLHLADELGISGVNCGVVRRIEDLLEQAIGRSLPVNVNGAIAAVMLDAGFPLSGIKGIALLARTASLIAHLVEEQSQPIGFVMSGAAAAAIIFTPPSEGGD